MSKQSGFTLIELIVVILILSILAATALPKYIDVQDDARSAAVAGVGGALSSAVALAHAQWFVNGATTTPGIVPGYGTTAGDIYANATGWPIDDDSTTVNCVGIWEGLLAGGAPSVSGTDPEYVATGPTSDVCTYTYSGDTAMNIQYNVTTGAVAITN